MRQSVLQAVEKLGSLGVPVHQRCGSVCCELQKSVTRFAQTMRRSACAQSVLVGFKKNLAV